MKSIIKTSVLASLFLMAFATEVSGQSRRSSTTTGTTTVKKNIPVKRQRH